jgi:soluble lytic murein transglycosylase
MLGLGLRSEGVKEWNFSLRCMGDRELLAAAQRACDQAVWDRCINTSERTRVEVDMAQRFVAPFRSDVLSQANAAGIDLAYVYGLIRQESRFVTDARSHVGASGLMQLMPATARWTARKIGLPYQPGQVTDLKTNLARGAGYLKLLLDNFGGSQALAAVAYNAGPSRSRRWRDGPVLDSAIWVENIPFNETRDYVKKVLTNAVDYASVLGQGSTSIRARLGVAIGPQEPGSPPADKDLP